MNEQLLTKREAGYDSTAGTSDRHCGPTPKWASGDCVMFRTPNACTKVFGDIAPTAWCTWWYPKT